MTAEEFIAFWKDRQDTDDSPAVGIGVYWDKIQPQNCTVQQFNGDEAWKNIETFYTPVWGNFERTSLKEWLNRSRPDYQKFIDEEKVKIQFYEQNGLVYPYFCAFADETGKIGVLGDGSHRFIDCNYLIFQGKDLSSDIKNCRLDVLCVPSLGEVLSRLDIPPNYLPKRLYEALKIVTEIFEQNNIDYWLGGGLFQLIDQNKRDLIERDYKTHDIDLHIPESQKETAYQALQSHSSIEELGIYPSGSSRQIKIAFKLGGLSIETPFLFDSPDDQNVVFFVSWGKKEDWPLSEDERQRFYYFSLPKEIFSTNTIKIGDIEIKVPKSEYVKFLYKL